MTEVEQGDNAPKQTIVQRFASVGANRKSPDDARLVYRPMLFASAQLHYVDAAPNNIDYYKTYSYLFLIKNEEVPIRWEKALTANIPLDSLSKLADEKIERGNLPPCAEEKANYKTWKAEFQTWLIAGHCLELLRCPLTQTTSLPEETEEDFRARLQHILKVKSDRLIAAVKEKYAARQAELQSKLAYAERILGMEVNQSETIREKQKSDSKSFGNSVFQTFTGRNMPSKMRGEDAQNRDSANLERVHSAQEQILQHQEYADNVRDQLDGLEIELQSQIGEIKNKLAAETLPLEAVKVSAALDDYNLLAFCMCWAPCFRQPDGKITAAW